MMMMMIGVRRKFKHKNKEKDICVEHLSIENKDVRSLLQYRNKKT